VKSWTIAGLSAVFIIAGGCQSHTKYYFLQGEVLEKDATAGQFTVKHDDIPGFMPAMTMPYKVKDPAALRDVQPGDMIAADLVAANDGKDYWLESVRITDQSGRETAKPVVKHALKVGDPAPDIALVNQDGKQIHFSDFKGKSVLITFIYTRCPIPSFCPRLSSQFARIHEDLAKTDDYNRTHLVTISFDPKYDTAPVLRKYGLAYLDDHAEGFAHWDFATADPAGMRQIADAFGLEYFEQDNQIAHSMDIVLLTPQGMVAKYWATEWTTAELEDALRREAKSSVSSAGRRGTKG
jgi:protein SCO1